MKPVDVRLIVIMILAFVLGACGAAVIFGIVAMLGRDGGTPYALLKDFQPLAVAFVAVSGVVITACVTYIGVLTNIQNERSRRKRELVSRGDAMMHEVCPRLYDLRWYRNELRDALLGHVDDLPEFIARDIFDKPGRAGFARLQTFARDGWTRLEGVHANQRNNIAYYLSSIDTGCENIEGLIERAEAMLRQFDRTTRQPGYAPDLLTPLRQEFAIKAKTYVDHLDTCINDACADYMAIYTNADLAF